MTQGELGTTPRPWSEFCEGSDWWIARADNPELSVCDADSMSTADMLLIIKAVNAHDELLSACEKALSFWERYIDRVGPSDSWAVSVRDQLRDAVAKTREG